MRILVVEDEQDLNRILAKTLKAEGYSVDSCFDGVEALDYLKGAEYDAVVLDVMMPRMDGFSVLAQMRADGNETPVLFLTAKDSVPDRVHGLDSGADDYLVKPFDILELLVRMEKVLARSDKHPQRFRYRDIAVDEASHTVTKSGTPVSLKPMEYELLLTFIRHPGMVMTREDLLHQVWGDAFIGETRTVDMHVAALRRKLDLGGELATVYKIGYRLEVLA